MPNVGPPRPVRGIVLAFVFDIVGTIIAVSILSIFYAWVLANQGLGQSEIEQAISSENLYTPYGLITTLVGLGFSYYSGHICIRISRGNTLYYPYVLAGLNIVFGLIISFSVADIGSMLVLTALGAGAVVLGAKQALRNYADDA